MHTVFGPTITELRRQNVIFTSTSRSGELAQEFEGIFYKYGATITHTTPEYHDRQMAFHQNLEHFTKVVWPRCCAHNSALLRMASYSSPNSRLSLITMGRVLKGDPAIICRDSDAKPPRGRDAPGVSAHRWRDRSRLDAGDASPFAQAMRPCGGVWKRFLTHAVNTSNAIQEATSIPQSRVVSPKPLSIHCSVGRMMSEAYQPVRDQVRQALLECAGNWNAARATAIGGWQKTLSCNNRSPRSVWNGSSGLPRPRGTNRAGG